MKRSLTLQAIVISFLLTASSSTCFAQCQTPQLLGINRIAPFGMYYALHSFSQPGTYYLEYGPVGFTPGTGATPGAGGTVKVLSSTFGVSDFSISGTGIRHFYLRLYCNNTTWTSNSPVLSYTLGAALSPIILPLNGFNVATPVGYNMSGYTSLLSSCGVGAGEESRLRFDCPDSSYYDVTFTGYQTDPIPSFSYKEMNSTTVQGSYLCQSATSNNSVWPNYSITYTLGPLAKGKVYDLLADATDTLPFYSSIKVSCPMPQTITVNNIEPTSVRLNWFCNCPDSMIVEYGPVNFVPGSGNIPGTNGTILVTGTSPFTINGLTPFTAYDIYVRSACGGNYGTNKKIRTKTAKDCNSYTTINCNTNAVFNYTGSSAVRGAWDGLGCVASGDSSEERVYKFTPATSGMHTLNVTNFTASHTGYVYTAHYSYKQVNAGCNELSWTCIGTSLENPLTFTPDTFAFGPLVAGTTYYIAADGQSFPSTRTYTYTFHIECPAPCTPPPTPGTITATGGNTKICPTPTEFKTYSIAAVPGATTYLWTPPAGSTIINGQGTTSVFIEFNTSFPISDTLRVAAINVCGSSLQQKLKISKNVPATPGTITVTGGTALVCPGDSRTYTILPLSTPAYYDWILPTGSYITSGTGTTSINVTFNAGFVTNDTIRVAGNNSCGSGAQRKLAVKRNNPGTPGTIVVSGGVAKVCPGETRTYTIPVATGATSYIWTPPAGSTITSGQGTVSVNVSFNSGFTTNDTLRVVSSNGCGISVQRKLNIARNIPATPGAITGQNYSLCNLNAIPYTITNVSGITYNWSFNNPAATVANGQGTNAITANFGTGYVSTILSVTASNGCGTSVPRNFTAYAKPATPAAITGPLTVCVNQQDVPYSIAPLTNVTNYTWLTPTGSHISDGIATSPSNTLTTTSTSVTVDFATTAGNVRVLGINACASGSYKTIVTSFTCREAFAENQIVEIFDANIIPNPNNGEFSIKIAGVKSNSAKGTIVDILGNVVNHFKMDNDLEATYDFNISPGIYFIRIDDNERRIVRKMVVQ